MAKSCDEYAREAIELCAGIIERHGSRVSGSEGCRDARAELESALGECCSKARREAFRISPASLFAIGKIFAIAYVAGLAAILLGVRVAYTVGFAAMAIGLAYFVTQFILHLDVFDGLFKKVDGENLIGVVEPLAEAVASSGGLSSTRLIVLLTDGEEVGQKGAKAFIAANRDIASELETSVINIDSIYEYEDIAVLERDRNGFSGTDGGQFARAGLATASVIGLPIGIGRKEIVMHTTLDRPDRIKPRAVACVIESLRAYIAADDDRGKAG